MNDTSHSSRLLTAGLSFLLVCALALAGCGGDDGGDDAVDSGADAPAPGADADPGASVVVLTVDGEPVTQGEIDAFLKGMMRFPGTMPPERMAMLRKQFGPTAEKRLIEQRLLEAAAKAGGFAATAEEIASRWQEIERSLPEGYTMEQHLARSELTKDEAESELGKMIALDKLLKAEATPAHPPGDAEARAYFETNKAQFSTPEQVRARHILLPVEAGADDAVKAATKTKIEGLRAQLGDGAKFEDLAREHSSCPTGKKGGDLGFFGRGQMVPEFDAAAFTLEPGTVSEVIKTQFGYHILRVEEKRAAGGRSFDEVKDTIKTQLHDKARQDARSAYVAELVKAATIERKSGT